MNRPFVLAEATRETTLATRFEVAILPWGATEAHNRHLPYATDTVQCDAVAARAAELAWRRGVRVLVLPTVPFGVPTGQREVPFCLNLNPSTYPAVGPRGYFTDPGDHAGELVTSVMMAVAPRLVRPLDTAGPSLRDGLAWTPRRWSRTTDDTGVGNPAAVDPNHLHLDDDQP